MLSDLQGLPFLAACAGSLMAVNAGATSQKGWIAQPPRRPGARRNGNEEVQAHQGQSAALHRAYYRAGYHETPVTEELADAADLIGVTPSTLHKYRRQERLQSRCEEWKAEGADARRAGLPAVPRFGNRLAAAEKRRASRLRGARPSA